MRPKEGIVQGPEWERGSQAGAEVFPPWWAGRLFSGLVWTKLPDIHRAGVRSATATPVLQFGIWISGPCFLLPSRPPHPTRPQAGVLSRRKLVESRGLPYPQLHPARPSPTFCTLYVFAIQIIESSYFRNEETTLTREKETGFKLRLRTGEGPRPGLLTPWLGKAIKRALVPLHTHLDGYYIYPCVYVCTCVCMYVYMCVHAHRHT